MKTDFDVIIIGGSYAGLSAAMALGRSLRNTLVIDSGVPCNRQTPHSHNLITHDGETPAGIAMAAREQVAKYPTVQFLNGLATGAVKKDNIFVVKTGEGQTFTAKKLLFTTGVTDVLPNIPGLAECWGISVLHCPYCHGYEVHQKPTGVFGNGDIAFEFTRLISNWTNNLTVLTNGPSLFSEEQANKFSQHGIAVVEAEVRQLNHKDGRLTEVVMTDETQYPLAAIYLRPGMKHHCDIPVNLNCELADMGYIKVDALQETSVKGVFAAGDITTMFRSLAIAIADGSKAGAMINKQLVEDSFLKLRQNTIDTPALFDPESEQREIVFNRIRWVKFL